MLSLRQRLLEDSHQMLDKYLDLNKIYTVQKGKTYNVILNDLQVRANNKEEKEAIVEGNITEIKWKRDIMDAQIQYYNSSIKTVDNILFGIKHRIDLEAIIRPGA